MSFRKKNRDVSPGAIEQFGADAAVTEPPGNRLVWSRLVLLIAIPTAAAIALGGTSVVSSWRSAAAYQRTQTLAVLSTKITQLAFEIEAERDAIVWYAASGNYGRAGLTGGVKNAAELDAARSQLQVVRQRIVFTNPWVKIVGAGVAQIGSGYTAAVRRSARAAASILARLPSLRLTVLGTELPVRDVIAEYNSVVYVLLAFDDEVALNSSDPQLQSTARAMSQISRVEAEDSVQRAIIADGLIAGRLNATLFQQLTGSQSQQTADSSEFRIYATASQANVYQSDLANTLEDRAASDVALVVSGPKSFAQPAIAPADWYATISDVIGGVHKFEEYLANSVVNRAKALHQRAITSTVAVGSLILLVLVLSLLFTVFVGRSMIRKSRQPRVAGVDAVAK